MTESRFVFVVTGLCAVLALGCAKEKEATSPPKEMTTPPAGVVAAKQTPTSASAVVSAQATVVAVDHKTRMVTLRTDDGEIHHFKVDESARNLPQVRKGDVVTMTYYESIALALREAKGEKPSVAVSESVDRAPLGEKPSGMVVRETTLVAKVTAVDKKKQTVTLEGPRGGKVTLKVENPSNMEHVKVGRLVEAKYREAVAIAVQNPEK